MIIHRNLFLLLAGLVACSFVEASPMAPETTTAPNMTTAANTTAANTKAAPTTILRILNELENFFTATANTTPGATGKCPPVQCPQVQCPQPDNAGGKVKSAKSAKSDQAMKSARCYYETRCGPSGCTQVWVCWEVGASSSPPVHRPVNWHQTVGIIVKNIALVSRSFFLTKIFTQTET